MKKTMKRKMISLGLDPNGSHLAAQSESSSGTQSCSRDE